MPSMTQKTFHQDPPLKVLQPLAKTEDEAFKLASFGGHSTFKP